MQLCARCDNYNVDESIFCGHCGNRLNNQCPDCGFRNLMDQKFCGSCGKQLQTDVALGGNAMQYGQAQSPSAQSASEKASARPATPPMRPENQSARTPEGKTLPELGAYALMSIEFANWKQVLAETTEPDKLETARKQGLQSISRFVAEAGGIISASKNNILFVSFRREPSPEASLAKAIELSLSLLADPFHYKRIAMPLRIGLDLEMANARNPLTSTLERSVGQPNTLTVSEQIYQIFGARYPMEVVGPVKMGNRTLRFYRMTPKSPAPPSPQPSVALPESPPVMPAPALRPTAQAPVPSPIPPEVDMPHVGVTSELPPAPSTPESTSKPLLEVSEVPKVPEFEPPTLGIMQSPRQENLTYEAAIDALTSEFSALMAQGANAKGKILSLSASDGLGKSSITHMARAKADPENQRAIWMGGHHYRCFHRAGLPLFFWLELIQNLLSLVFEGQPGQHVREELGKFLNLVYEGEPPAEELAFLLDFLSVNPPQPLDVDARGNLGLVEAFFLNFFRVLCAKKPVIVVMEDAMFADPASLDLFARLLELGLLNSPICWVLTHSRDFYAHGRLAELFQKLSYKELVVGNLDDASARKFLDDGPLGGNLNQIPAQIIQSVLKHAGGLPLYLEESLRLMHLRGILTVDATTSKFIWNQDYDFDAGPLPEYLTEVIFARFEFLTEQALYLLQLASVLGEKFAVNLLFALAQLDEETFNESLTMLFDHGYLMPDAVNTGRFRHGQIWETVYETIKDELRVQMHQLVSEALENDFNQQVTVNPALIAYHAQNGELPNRALNYWNLAGVYCGQIGSLLGLNLCMFHALNLLAQNQEGPLHTQELALRMMETTGVFNLEANPDLATHALEWVIYYRAEDEDALKLIEPLGYLASAHENRGDFPKALETLEESLTLIDPASYPLEAAALQINKLEYLYTLGRLRQAFDLMETGIEPAYRRHSGQNPDFQDAFLQARLLKAQIMLAQCNPEVGIYVDSCLMDAKTRELDGLQIALRLLQGQIHLRNGMYETCNREADGLLSAIEAMQDSDWFLAQWGLLAIMYHCELGDWTSASQLVLTVMSKAEAVRDYQTQVVAQAYAGYIASRLGKVKEARQLIEQAIGQSSDRRFASSALLGWRLLAEMELSLNNIDVAYEIAFKALEVANKPDIQNTYEAMLLTLICARALLAKGQAKEAGKFLEPLWPQMVKTRWQPLIAQCAFEIGQLYKALAQNVPADLSRKYLTRSIEFFLKAKGIWLELGNLAQVRKIDQVAPRL